MADDITTPAAQPGAPGSTGPAAKRGFFSTPRGRLVGIVGGIAVLAIILGIVAAVVISSLASRLPEVEVRVPDASQPGQGGSAATSTAEVKQPAPAVANDEVFTFRDIFEPLIKPASDTTASPTEETTGSAETTPGGTYAENTLYLLAIRVEDGVPTGVFVWNGTQYELTAGGAIPSTPWQLLEVRTDAAVMLYGDERVVLYVGQGVQK